MDQLFSALPVTQRPQYRAHYARVLYERNGEPQLASRTFSTRETFFRELERHPVRWQGKPLVDPEVFSRNMLRDELEEGLDEATLWALAVAKVNNSERYGIELAIARRSTVDLGDPYCYTEIEEFYHTRILRDVVESLGLSFDAQPPRRLTRYLIHSMVFLPKLFANILVFVAEVGGVVIFSKLLDKGRALLASQPELLAQTERLFGQIITDEIGHVYFLRSTLGQKRLSLARQLMPFIIRRMLDEQPEVTSLFSKEELLSEILSCDMDRLRDQYAPALRFPARPAAQA